MIWLAVGGMLGWLPREPLFGFVAMAISVALVTLGLLSSTFHLGRPERAWRSLSQWRSSWLSREGIAALITYLPAAILGLAWVSGEFVRGQFVLGALLAIPCAAATIWCGGMIYASLPTIRAWHQPLVAPAYLVLGLATGGVLLDLLAAAFAIPARWAAIMTLLALGLGAFVKTRYWTIIDQAARTWTAESATGLGRFGAVRPLDPPHTQPNFVMREMGYRVARRHANRLRQFVLALLFAVPAATTLLLLFDIPSAVRIVVATIATAGAGIGVLVERWLFFAEAEHVVTVYYRGGSA
jgi:DMSO reductase anchor subunit